MSVKCSSKQISDFVAFWGMTETFPEYCEYADDALNLKSLDLIISTLDVFVQAFSSNFENIYRKYKVDFPLSEEKFIEFFKPRCLLLTKDNKCFNFMLVCAFVYDIIHSISYSSLYYNKCSHLVKVASKCLAAILKYRFKGIFETDSGWEELMTFCIKIHSLVYPPAKVCKSDGDRLLCVTDNMDASFLNMSQRLEEMSVEKYVTISDNNDDESDTKMSGKETSKSLTNDPTTENEGRDSEDFNSSESPASKDAPHTLHFYDKGSLKSENVPDQNNRREDNDKNFITKSLLPVLSVTSAGTGKLDRIICHKGNLTLSFDDYLALKKVTERLEYLRNLGLSLTDALQTFQLKIENFSPKKAEGRNENDSTTDWNEDNSEKTTINIKEDNEKHDQMNLKKHLTISFDDYLSMKKVIERLEDLCHLGLSSKDASQALQLRIEDLSPTKAEDKEKTHDGADVRKKNEECATDPTNSSLPKLKKGFTDNVSEKTAIKSEKLNESTDFKKNLTLSFEDYLAIKKGVERLEHLCNLGLHSTIPLYIDSSPQKENKEKICSKNDGKKNNGECVIVDSSISDLAEDITNTIVNNEDGNTEKLNQMIGFHEHLILLLGKDLAVKKEPETSHLCNFEYDSSTCVAHSFQLKCEDLYPNSESEDKEKRVDKNNAKDSNGDVTDSFVPDLAHELTKISIGNKPIKKNVKQTPGEIGCRKNLNLPFSEDSNAQNMKKKLCKKSYKKLCKLQNLESSSLTDASHALKDKECSSKNEFEDNKEPFNIHIMSEDKIRARITENPQHLSEIMDLLKKCEGDIESNMFSPDEYDIPIDDSDEDEELDASGVTSKSSTIGDQKIFESSIKTMVFTQNMKMAHSIKRNHSEDYQSDDEILPKVSGGLSSHEMTEYSNQIFQSEDPSCSLCAEGMVNFFDTCVHNFAKKYPNNDQVTDLFRFDFYEDSE